MILMKYNWLIYFFLFFSPLMVMSVNNLYSMWLLMELNMVMFLLYMILNNKNSYECSMKYFFMNSFSSMIFIMMTSMNLLFNLTEFYMIIINMMMYMKLGMFPFHFWFIDLMLNLNWLTCFILSVWQKLIPVIILMVVYNKILIFSMILMNGFISVIFVMKEMMVKIIMGYSSINHMCWILIILMYSKILFIFYFLSYMFINMMLMFIYNEFDIMHYMDFTVYDYNFMKYLMMFMNFSLGGLPPFFGFLMKWYFMFYMIYMNNFFVLIILIIYSLIYLYNYLRLMFMLMLNEYTSIKFYKFNLTIKLNYTLIYLLMNFFIFMLFIYDLLLFY